MASDANKPNVAAVLLAAGESTRMQQPKALLPWVNDELLISYQVHALHGAGYDPIVVVLGHNPYQIDDALPDDVYLTAIVNDRYKMGRSTSIVTGVLRVATPGTDALLILRLLRVNAHNGCQLLPIPDHLVGGNRIVVSELE